MAYKDDGYKIKSFYICLTKMSVHARCFDDAIHMSFLQKMKMLEKYHKIFDKINGSIKKEIDIKPAKSEKYLRTKKNQKGKINQAR